MRMERASLRMRGRTLVAAALVLAGLALAAFYILLFAIADCSGDCVAAGERAVPLALVGAGAGLVAAGLALRRGRRLALGVGLVAGGALAALAIVWIMASEGARGMAVWLLVAALALAAAGGFALRSRAPSLL
jgi:hypothetical protein